MTRGPATLQRRIVAVAARPGDIALGPDHPTLDGMPSLEVTEHDGVAVAGSWVPGTVHRGAEKLFESRDYRQILALVDRHDWLSAFCSELGVAVGIERALGLAPPPRAQQIRIMLAELTRIAHHLAFLAPLPGPLPAEWRGAGWAWREEVLDLIEGATGHRVHPMFAQAGGVRADVSVAWVDDVAQRAGGRWAARLAALDSAVLADLLDHHYAGVAQLSSADALGHGASGPVARASGIDLDLRRDDPALPYPPLDVALGSRGDARDRVRLLIAEIEVSITLVAWAAEQLTATTGQPVSVRLPKVLRVPEGTWHTWTENPTGINGYLLVSRNDRTPWRLKLRSAGFGNASALSAALPGTGTADLPAAVASMFLVCGDVDR